MKHFPESQNFGCVDTSKRSYITLLIYGSSFCIQYKFQLKEQLPRVCLMQTMWLWNLLLQVLDLSLML